MPREIMAHDVFQAAYDRLRRLYDHGDRVVVSCSGGKDSTVCVELAILAARDAGRLPVEVVMRDEEIMLPGTFEYCERLANRTDEVDFHWIIAGQPIVNVFNRYNPYFWVFDQALDPDKWVRKWPGFDRGVGPETDPLVGRQPYWISTQNIQGICDISRFPPPWEDLDSFRDEEGNIKMTGPGNIVSAARSVNYYSMEVVRRGKPVTSDAMREAERRYHMPRLVGVMGLRTAESPRRLMGLLSKKGYMSLGVSGYGSWEATPIYDWQDGDVWKFIRDFGLDFNSAYNTMRRMGITRNRLRIAPPTLTSAGLAQMQVAAKAWPRWFDRVADRLDGVRTAAQFGRRAISPYRRLGETWRQTFHREIVDAPSVPEWIKERAIKVRDERLRFHRGHAGSAPFPDAARCPQCTLGCWKDITMVMYNGDPFAMKANMLSPIEPEFFRPGAGTWGRGGSFFQ